MARPEKTGLDYFSLDVDMDQDDKIMLIEAKHGIAGFGIVIRLLMKIYKEGYFYRWTEREQLLFSKRVNVDIYQVNEVVNDCIKWDLFNEEIYKKHQVLTSKGIQKRYLAAVGRRNSITLIRDYLLVDPAQFYKKQITFINADNNPVNANNNPHSDTVNNDTSTQSKVKESKVKESNSADVSADINADNDDSKWTEIDKVFSELSGIPIPSPADVQAMKEAVQIAGGRTDLIIEVMRQCHKNYKPPYPGAKIRTFRYFLPAIREAAATVKARTTTPKGELSPEEKEKIERLTQEIMGLLPDDLREVVMSGQ